MATKLAPGTIIAGRYKLEALLGQGGMGAVWAATHTVTRRQFALKFLRGPAHTREHMKKRFLREARAASLVDHPNVVEINDVFELDDETPVMVMPLLEGETLGAMLERKGRLSLAELADVLLPVVSAVGAAHAAGIVHRDLKPDNVFITREGRPLVLDFGIAKLVSPDTEATGTGVVTGTGAMLGTPCYMAPEQGFGEKDIDHRADVWALGIIIYEALWGQRPVDGDNLGQVLKRLMSEQVPPLKSVVPDAPDDLAELVDSMLRRDRKERAQDLREVASVLERHASNAVQSFGPPRAKPISFGDDSYDSDSERVRIRVGRTVDPEASTAHSDPGAMVQSGSVKDTAEPHTLTASNGKARPAVVAGVVVAAIVGAVAVWRPWTSSADSAAAPAESAATATSEAPEPELSAQPEPPAQPQANPSAASEPELAEDAGAADAGAARAAAPAPRPRPAGARPAPAPRPATEPAPAAEPAPAPSPAPAPAPAPSPTRKGGLVEEPPF